MGSSLFFLIDTDQIIKTHTHYTLKKKTFYEQSTRTFFVLFIRQNFIFWFAMNQIMIEERFLWDFYWRRGNILNNIYFSAANSGDWKSVVLIAGICDVDETTRLFYCTVQYNAVQSGRRRRWYCNIFLWHGGTAMSSREWSVTKRSEKGGWMRATSTRWTRCGLAQDFL